MPLTRPLASTQPHETGTAGSGFAGKLPLIILAVLFILSVAGFIWSYINYNGAKKQLVMLTNPQAQQEAAKKETQDLVEKIKKLVVLPEGEDPTVATITDAPALAKEQPFYKDAHNGDKLLVYMQARKAFIYDPNRNILVNVGPIYMENNAQPPVLQGTINVEVRNGSTVSGQGVAAADDLKKTSNFNVVKVANAGKDSYRGNTVVDLTKGDKSSLVNALKTKLNAEVVNVLPEGEKGTEAEVLVIIGNQQ